MQGNLLQIQGWKAIWNKQQVWERTEEMLSMWALHKLGWQALPMLWLHPEDKAKRNADKTTIKDVATGKTIVDWRLWLFPYVRQESARACLTTDIVLISALVAYCLKGFLIQYDAHVWRVAFWAHSVHEYTPLHSSQTKRVTSVPSLKTSTYDTYFLSFPQLLHIPS